MPVLFFSINPAAVSQLHDILACLAKFDEDVSIEATQSELRVSSLNVSKTAYAAFTLASNRFFDKYHFSSDQRGSNTPKIWACKLQNRKALASVFRKRLAESRDKDNGIERCEFELQAKPDLPECRIVIRLICHQGIVKTYRLTYETGEILHASFDKATSNNSWIVSSRTLASVVEYFGPKTEQLDWFLQDDKVTFTSYTERVQNGKEVLKQPMHTSVALERQDFDECAIEPGLHIGIVVKDFRAIVAHAVTLHAHINARYSRGNRPMQLGYSVGGLQSDFTLMTRGISKIPLGAAASTPARDLSVRPRSQLTQTARGVPAGAARTDPSTGHGEQNRNDSIRQPQHEPRAETESVSRRRTPPATAASINPDSLFIPADDNDQQWDEPNYDEGAHDFVTWDASETGDSGTSVRRLRDSEEAPLPTRNPRAARTTFEIAPTQRLSQVKGLFD